jgi:hypothetical protein
MSQSQLDSTVLELVQRSLGACCQHLEDDNYDAARIILHEAADYVDAALGQQWCTSSDHDLGHS